MPKKRRKAQVVVCMQEALSQNISFLILQTNKKRGQFWQNVTGSIDEDETYLEGALREAKEETGIGKKNIEEIIDLEKTHRFIDRKNREVKERVFLLLAKSSWKIQIDPKEHSDYKWIEMTKALDNPLEYPTNNEALELAAKFLKEKVS